MNLRKDHYRAARQKAGLTQGPPRAAEPGSFSLRRPASPPVRRTRPSKWGACAALGGPCVPRARRGADGLPAVGPVLGGAGDRALRDGESSLDAAAPSPPGPCDCPWSHASRPRCPPCLAGAGRFNLLGRSLARSSFLPPRFSGVKRNERGDRDRFSRTCFPLEELGARRPFGASPRRNPLLRPRRAVDHSARGSMKNAANCAS